MMKTVIFLGLLTMRSTVFAVDFYTTRNIPLFSQEEKQTFDEFGIQFKKLNTESKITKHNRQVRFLIDQYGDHWRDTLTNRLSPTKDETASFIRHLFGYQGIGEGRKDRTLYYHVNGMILSSKKQVELRGNGGGMYHYKIKYKRWDKKGKKMPSTTKTMRGSAC